MTRQIVKCDSCGNAFVPVTRAKAEHEVAEQKEFYDQMIVGKPETNIFTIEYFEVCSCGGTEFSESEDVSPHTAVGMIIQGE